jgi:ferrous iron transport protein B
MSILFGSTQSLMEGISIAAAAALLVFCLLYTPFVAAVASIKRELGGKWAVAVVITQCVVAWIAAFVVYLLVGMFM